MPQNARSQMLFFRFAFYGFYRILQDLSKTDSL